MIVKTGKLPLPLMALVAILSLSLVVNLPGLAITPMLGTLAQVFPDTTQLDKQLLTMLPNLLIIPCLLLSGRLSLSHHKIAVVVTALCIYAVCGVLYLVADSMAQLIVISCLLGVGAGLLIPFSTGLLADTFAGSYRMRQMGLQSAISNMTLVCATYVVGWLSHGDWHLPFVVYLIPVIPLVLARWLRKIPAEDLYDSCDSSQPTADPACKPEAVAASGKSRNGYIVGRLVAIIGVYFFVTYATIVVSYYCPFLVEKEHWSSSLTGTITAVYFLFIFLPGFLLPQIIKVLQGRTLVVSAVAIVAGLALFAFVRTEWAMIAGAALMGAGYGTFQPVLYNKATFTVTNPSKSTMALALVLIANYGAIAVTPVIIDGFRSLLHAQNVTAFAFILNFVISVAFLIVAIVFRRSFAFRTGSDVD
ncbi:MFS transporter [uncultured Duncaniella sp.]|uniref:MFS transporter n=1 Tax=uncultured Duncaniella sp. TaxID=2768039 RepID=UPI0026E5700A|nr:MFS transporter [uncultured Duncaniella sp.]